MSGGRILQMCLMVPDVHIIVHIFHWGTGRLGSIFKVLGAIPPPPPRISSSKTKHRVDGFNLS
jgi:hypothetical protein